MTLQMISWEGWYIRLAKKIQLAPIIFATISFGIGRSPCFAITFGVAVLLFSLQQLHSKFGKLRGSGAVPCERFSELRRREMIRILGRHCDGSVVRGGRARKANKPQRWNDSTDEILARQCFSTLFFNFSPSRRGWCVDNGHNIGNITLNIIAWVIWVFMGSIYIVWGGYSVIYSIRNYWKVAVNHSIHNNMMWCVVVFIIISCDGME